MHVCVCLCVCVHARETVNACVCVHAHTRARACETVNACVRGCQSVSIFRWFVSRVTNIQVFVEHSLQTEYRIYGLSILGLYALFTYSLGQNSLCRNG